MLHFIRDAGFPVYAVLAFGLCSLYQAAQYARFRDRSTLALIAGWSLLTLLAGALAVAMGFSASVRTVAEVPNKWLFLYGLREALNNGVLALGIVLVDALVVTLTLGRPDTTAPRTREASAGAR